MSNTQLAEKPKQPQTLMQVINGDVFKSQIARALPTHFKPDRMIRIASTQLTKNPELRKCTQESFVRCLLDLSAWGLEPDGRRAHLIPFNNRKLGVVECTLILDYKGIVELCFRSGIVEVIHADVVREGDDFEYQIGMVVKHVPWFLRRDANKPEKPGDIYAVYCQCKLKGAALKCEVMSKTDIDGIRSRSKAGQSGPWCTDWNEMAKKTVFRRLSKWLPLSAEIRDAVDGDDDVVDGEFQPERKPTLKGLDDLAERMLEGPATKALPAPQDEQQTGDSSADAEPLPQSENDESHSQTANDDPLAEEEFHKIAEASQKLAACKTAADVNMLEAVFENDLSAFPNALRQMQAACEKARNALKKPSKPTKGGQGEMFDRSQHPDT